MRRAEKSDGVLAIVAATPVMADPYLPTLAGRERARHGFRDVQREAHPRGPRHSRQHLSNDTSCRSRRRGCWVHLPVASPICETQISLGKALRRALCQGAAQLLPIKRRKADCL